MGGRDGGRLREVIYLGTKMRGSGYNSVLLIHPLLFHVLTVEGYRERLYLTTVSQTLIEIWPFTFWKTASFIKKENYKQE